MTFVPVNQIKGARKMPPPRPVLKSLIEMVEENAKFVAVCPSCTQTPRIADSSCNQMGPGNNGVHKRGRWKGLKRSSLPACSICQGHGVVFLNRTCECGWPAIIYDKTLKIYYCGAELCGRIAAYRAKGGYASEAEAYFSGLGG